VVLTTSQAEKDIFKSYDLQANAYGIKLLNFDQFIMVVKSIENFWLEKMTGFISSIIKRCG
jgi:hypothetical protein